MEIENDQTDLLIKVFASQIFGVHRNSPSKCGLVFTKLVFQGGASGTPRVDSRSIFIL